MTVDLKAIRERAESLAHLDDPGDPYPADLVGELSCNILALLDRIESFGADASGRRPAALPAIPEYLVLNMAKVKSTIDSLTRQLAAMTAARDELAETLEAYIPDPPRHDAHMVDRARIAELAKVGSEEGDK